MIGQETALSTDHCTSKCSCVLAVCRLIAWWLGWKPATFYQLYTSETLLLLTVRWAVYRFQRVSYVGT